MNLPFVWLCPPLLSRSNIGRFVLLEPKCASSFKQPGLQLLKQILLGNLVVKTPIHLLLHLENLSTSVINKRCQKYIVILFINYSCFSCKLVFFLISKWRLQENAARQIFRKKEFIPLVFLLAPFWYSSFALLPTICWCMQRTENTTYNTDNKLTFNNFNPVHFKKLC